MPVGNATTAKFEDNPANHQKHHDRAHHHHARKMHEKSHPSSKYPLCYTYNVLNRIYLIN